MISARSHRSSAWEAMPIPPMVDMNRSGTGITFPERQIWRNGRMIDLDALLEESGWENIEVEQINEDGTLLGSGSEIGGNGDVVPVLLQAVRVKDNLLATGVDALSRTVDPADPGYQKDFWIMAPLQGPPLPGGAAYENLSGFNVAGKAGGTATLSVANATPDDSQIVVGDDGFDGVTWQGSGDGVDSEERMKITITGQAGEKQMPVMVKAMKYRTVKLKVYRSVRKKSDGSVVPIDSDIVPDKGELETHLNQLFGYQLNAWFDVEFADDTEEVEWGEEFTYTGSSTEHSTDQDDVITAHSGLDANFDMHLFLLGHDGLLECGHDGKGALAVGISGQNTCWVLARPVVSGLNTEEKVLRTIGHEIGHIFFGPGHPDDPDPDNRGVAPLQGTDHTKRLMYGNTKDTDSRLCVKTEWDEAEVWLKNNPDEREDN